MLFRGTTTRGQVGSILLNNVLSDSILVDSLTSCTYLLLLLVVTQPVCGLRPVHQTAPHESVEDQLLWNGDEHGITFNSTTIKVDDISVNLTISEFTQASVSGKIAVSWLLSVECANRNLIEHEECINAILRHCSYLEFSCSSSGRTEVDAKITDSKHNHFLLKVEKLYSLVAKGNKDRNIHFHGFPIDANQKISLPFKSDILSYAPTQMKFNFSFPDDMAIVIENHEISPINIRHDSYSRMFNYRFNTTTQMFSLSTFNWNLIGVRMEPPVIAGNIKVIVLRTDKDLKLLPNIASNWTTQALVNYIEEFYISYMVGNDIFLELYILASSKERQPNSNDRRDSDFILDDVKEELEDENIAFDYPLIEYQILPYSDVYDPTDGIRKALSRRISFDLHNKQSANDKGNNNISEIPWCDGSKGVCVVRKHISMQYNSRETFVKSLELILNVSTPTQVLTFDKQNILDVSSIKSEQLTRLSDKTVNSPGEYVASQRSDSHACIHFSSKRNFEFGLYNFTVVFHERKLHFSKILQIDVRTDSDCTVPLWADSKNRIHYALTIESGRFPLFAHTNVWTGNPSKTTCLGTSANTYKFVSRHPMNSSLLDVKFEYVYEKDLLNYLQKDYDSVDEEISYHWWSLLENEYERIDRYMNYRLSLRELNRKPTIAILNADRFADYHHCCQNIVMVPYHKELSVDEERPTDKMTLRFYREIIMKEMLRIYYEESQSYYNI